MTGRIGPLGGAVNSMRERGFLDASAGKAPLGVAEVEPKLAAAYRAGYRLGAREKERERERAGARR